MIRVLFVNHTSVVGGAEHWLLDLLTGLDSTVEPVVACPPGELQSAVATAGVRVHDLRGTDGSLRLHAWHTTHSLFELAATAVAIRRLARRLSADLVHANSVRSGLAAVMATRLGGPPAIVHVHDCFPEGRVTNVVQHTIHAGAAMVIANSGYTAHRFGSRHEDRPPVVIWNPVDLERFDAASWNTSLARRHLGLGADEQVLGVVAQLTPWKGQDDAVRAAAIATKAGCRVRLLIVGKAKFTAGRTRYDNMLYEQRLRRLVEQQQMDDAVTFLGEREDIPLILSALDLLLVPSWEEPFGRIVVEGMAMAIPVIATALGGPSEIIEDGRDGLLLPPHQPARWSQAILELLSDQTRRTEMGRRAAEKARERFGSKEHVAAVVDVYRRVLLERT